MRIRGEHYETIWLDENDPQRVVVIDQRRLPFELVTCSLTTAEDVYRAIREMTVRGAPLIGVTGAFGIYLAALRAGKEGWKNETEHAKTRIAAARPTAINLFYALDRIWDRVKTASGKTEAVELALNGALGLLDEEREHCRRIGEHGVKLIESVYRQKKSTVNILTHCNAGWLACIDFGTATAPIYMAHDLGIPVHVWVDETRPRNQGARLTAFELGEHGVPNTLIVDNAGGHLMQHGMVDLVIVGSDRTTGRGDVANKIGTYLKALAAKDNDVPFYVALPTTSIDRDIREGIDLIPIEERDPEEVLYMEGIPQQPGRPGDGKGRVTKVKIAPEGTTAANYGFDVTPAELVTAWITEEGVWEDLEGKLQ